MAINMQQKNTTNSFLKQLSNITGGFRYVYRGSYTSGPRKGEECVAGRNQ